MQISNDAIKLLKQLEGCPMKDGQAVGYIDCIGIPTIGWGHTGTVDGVRIYVGMLIPLSRATKLLEEDLNEYSKAVAKYNSKYNWTQNEFDALTIFSINNGGIDQLTAKGTRSKATIAKKMLEYNKGKKKGVLVVIPGLVIRRDKEQALFLSGSTCNDTKPTSYPVPSVAVTSKSIAIKKGIKTYVSKGDQVKWVQDKLTKVSDEIKKLIEDAGGIDGTCGDGTAECIGMAQEVLGLKADCVCGKDTRTALSKY